jgi:transcriptional regulator with XRE-family HTH domain
VPVCLPSVRLVRAHAETTSELRLAGTKVLAGRSTSPAFADWVREQRLERGLSQEALARELGISRNSPWRWEKGDRPRSDHYERLVAFFGQQPPGEPQAEAVSSKQLQVLTERLEEQNDLLWRQIRDVAGETRMTLAHAKTLAELVISVRRLEAVVDARLSALERAVLGEGDRTENDERVAAAAERAAEPLTRMMRALDDAEERAERRWEDIYDFLGSRAPTQEGRQES